MKKTFLSAFLTIAMLAVASLASAQTTATPTQQFAWDQAATTLVEAQGLTYKYYQDGAAIGTTFLAVTCTGATSPFLCSVNIPAFTPGSHTVALTASNLAGESAKSTPFAFVFVVTPATPTGIRIR